jgi:hypothetical protein
MNRTLSPYLQKAAFSLAEVIISAGVTSAILASLALGVSFLQRSYQAGDYYSQALGDQTRAIDYIVRDARRAITTSVSSDARMITFTVPDYYSSYDAQGNPSGDPLDPAIVDPVVNYGDAAKPVTVVYFASGQSLIRQVTIGKTGSTSQSVIASGVDNFAFTFAGADSMVRASLTFSGRFRGIASGTDQSTRLAASAYMRNPKRN